MYQARVHLGEKDPALARDKAERIYDFLGPDFFQEVKTKTRDYIVTWLYVTLRNEDLLIEFEDKNDAMLFKLTFA